MGVFVRRFAWPWERAVGVEIACTLPYRVEVLTFDYKSGHARHRLRRRGGERRRAQRTHLVGVVPPRRLLRRLGGRGRLLHRANAAKGAHGARAPLGGACLEAERSLLRRAADGGAGEVADLEVANRREVREAASAPPRRAAAACAAAGPQMRNVFAQAEEVEIGERREE